jgi:hypothetical protein
MDAKLTEELTPKIFQLNGVTSEVLIQVALEVERGEEGC